MKIKQLILLLITLFIIIIGTTTTYFAFFKVLKVESSAYSFSVQNRVGLVGDRDAVKFGGIPSGGWGKRSVNINNTYDFNIKIKITILREKR